MERTIIDRLQSLENRLVRIEKQLNIPAPAEPKQDIPQIQPSFPPTKTGTHEVSVISPGKLLGLISIVCFVLAAGFIIKLSIDSGWLTPIRQVCIAALFGLALICVGLRFLTLDREYISLLPAAGIIILYLSDFAAQRLYSLISFEFALIYAGAISLICIGLYLKIRHDIYPIVAAVGSYLAPILLDVNADAIFSLYYFVVCSVTFTILSIMIRYRMLTMISAYLAILFSASIGSDLVAVPGFNQQALIAYVLALHFIIFSLGTYLYSRITLQPLSDKEAWRFFPVLLIFYSSEYYFLSMINSKGAAWLSLAFAAFLLILYYTAEMLFNKKLASQTMIFTLVAIIVFHAGYIELLPPNAGCWLLVAIIATLAMLPASLVMTNKNMTSYWPIVLLSLLVVSIEYAKMVINFYPQYQSLFGIESQPIFWPAVFLAIASIWLFYFRQKQQLIERDEGFGYALLAAVHLLVISAFYNLADPHGSLAVSASWLVYAVLVMGVAYKLKDKIMARSALLVLGVAAGKALLYDAASAPTIVRILCLLVTGAVLYGAGFVFRKVSEWQN